MEWKWHLVKDQGFAARTQYNFASERKNISSRINPGPRTKFQSRRHFGRYDMKTIKRCTKLHRIVLRRIDCTLANWNMMNTPQKTRKTSVLASCITAGLLAISQPLLLDESKAQENTRNGAVIGGVAGAVIGGVVGHNHKDQTAEGALIGGAVGAVAGGIFGNQRDKLERQRRAYEQQRQQFYQQQTYRHPPGYQGRPNIIYSNQPTPRYNPPTRSVRRPVTYPEVIQMTRSGVSESVIAGHIQTNGVWARPDVDEVILLSQEGVSDYVIQTMQAAVVTGAGTPLPPPPPSNTPLVQPQPYSNGTTSLRPSSSRITPSNANTPRFEPPPLLERRGF